MLIVYTLWCDIHNECKHIRNYSIHSIHSKCVNINKFESRLDHWRSTATATVSAPLMLATRNSPCIRTHTSTNTRTCCISFSSLIRSFILWVAHTFVRSFCFFLWSDYIYFVAFVILIIVVTAHTAPKNIIQPTSSDFLHSLRVRVCFFSHFLVPLVSKHRRCRRRRRRRLHRTISNLLSEQLKSLNK